MNPHSGFKEKEANPRETLRTSPEILRGCRGCNRLGSRCTRRCKRGVTRPTTPRRARSARRKAVLRPGSCTRDAFLASHGPLRPAEGPHLSTEVWRKRVRLPMRWPPRFTPPSRLTPPAPYNRAQKRGRNRCKADQHAGIGHQKNTFVLPMPERGTPHLKNAIVPL